MPAAPPADPGLPLIVPLRPCVSAVICVHQQAEHLAHALAALAGQTRPPDEIIVVDDGTQPPLTVPGGIRGLRHDLNRGLGAARATALAAATGDYIFFIDADVVPAPDCLAHLLATLHGDRECAGAGALVNEQAVTLWDRYRMRYLAQNPAGPVSFLPGLAALYRRDLLIAAGGFDPRYRSNGEDHDLGRRLTAAGWRLARGLPARVAHHRRDNFYSFLRLLWRYHYFEGLVRRRHQLPWFWNRWLLPPLNLLAVARRAVCVDRDPLLLLPALLALPVRWWAACCLTMTRA